MLNANANRCYFMSCHAINGYQARIPPPFLLLPNKSARSRSTVSYRLRLLIKSSKDFRSLPSVLRVFLCPASRGRFPHESAWKWSRPETTSTIVASRVCRVFCRPRILNPATFRPTRQEVKHMAERAPARILVRERLE